MATVTVKLDAKLVKKIEARGEKPEETLSNIINRLIFAPRKHDGWGVRKAESFNECEICGTNKDVNTHHIDGVHHHNNYGNIRFLCRRCHRSLHGEEKRKLKRPATGGQLKNSGHFQKGHKNWNVGQRWIPDNALHKMLDMYAFRNIGLSVAYSLIALNLSESTYHKYNGFMKRVYLNISPGGVEA